MTGLAQKNGAVVSHVRIADAPDELCTPCASPPARRELVLGCDIVAGVGDEALAKMQNGVTRAVVNTAAGDAGALRRATPISRFPLGVDGARHRATPVGARRRRVRRRDRGSPPR